MEDRRTAAADPATLKRLQIQRRAKRGLVAGYIHGLSVRHAEGAKRAASAHVLEERAGEEIATLGAAPVAGGVVVEAGEQLAGLDRRHPVVNSLSSAPSSGSAHCS